MRRWNRSPNSQISVSRRVTRWMAWWRCAARCTNGPSWATTSRSRARTCSGRSTACRWRSRSTARPAASPRCSMVASPARRCCCAPTWMRCRCTRIPARSARRVSTARCTPAATTRTRRCWSGRHACCPIDAVRSPGGCCSCSSPVKRGSAAPSSCSMKVCSTFRRGPTAASHRSRVPTRCTSPASCRADGSPARAARSWRRPTPCRSW